MNDANRAPADGSSVATSRPGINAPLFIVLGALALTALLYWPTSLEIADLWGDAVRRRYTHGWVVLAVTVGLLWRDRHRLAVVLLQPPRLGWLLPAAGSITWLVGYGSGLLALTTLLMPVLALSATWAAGGWALARRAAFPLLFLYFALPVWELLNTLLQDLTAVVNLWLTQLAGIPVIMDGNIIHIPEGWFEIAGGCSGLHFFIVALAIATLHTHVDRDDARSRAMLLALAGGLALLTNWIRVFIIIVAGHLTDMQHFLVKVDHYYFGWVLFAFALVGYVYLAGHLPRRARAARETAPASAGASTGRVRAAAALAVTALAAGPAWALVQPSGSSVAALPPPAVAGWSGPESLLGDWRPVFANPDDESLVEYFSDSAGAVAVYRAIYRSQRQGKELRGGGNTVVGEHYRELSAETIEVRVGASALPVVERRVESRDGRQRLVWSLFAVAGEPTAMGLLDQVAYGVSSLFGPPLATVVALSAECNPDCDRAGSALGMIAPDALPALLAELPGGLR
jgi:EpsI family protein